MNTIPTNIITGFLGVGKTTAILHLLRHKPGGEIWSVLVNEFGEIGIDGAMLKETGSHVREVPGGCICCVAGLPMKIALNMLIATTKPDRILIEPTGLGHPDEIVIILTGEYYDTVLDLRATITLIDPRKLSDKRYSGNTNFLDQIAIADVLVANKLDLASEEDKEQFSHFVDDLDPKKKAVYQVEQGQLLPEWLDLTRLVRANKSSQRTKAALPSLQRDFYNSSAQLPQGRDFQRKENAGQDFFSCGWMVRPDWQFDFNLLFLLLTGLAVMRAKAVVNTDQGIYSFNSENGVLSVNQLSHIQIDDLLDSRIELINDQPIDADTFEQQLLSLTNRNVDR